MRDDLDLVVVHAAQERRVEHRTEGAVRDDAREACAAAGIAPRGEHG